MVGGMQLWAAGGTVLGLALAAGCNSDIKVLDAADRDGPMRGGAGVAVAAGSGVPGLAGRAAAGGSGERGTGAAGSGASGLPRAPRPDADGCIAPRFDPLFEASDIAPIVQQRADGAIVTRGAGRVRGRHELEGTYSPYGALYFEHRSYAFTIVDHVAAGGDTVEFTYEPEAPVSDNGPTTNFRHWKIYGDGNVFHSNVSMVGAGDSRRKLDYTVARNARDERAMRAGDVLEFEFGIFISGNADGDRDPIEGRNSYYTDTFRYRVGTGGLSADNADTSGTLGPAAPARLGGDTTIPWIYAEPELYFSQMALNMQPEHVQAFLRGRRLFHTDFENGEHSEGGNPSWNEQAGKLGPLFDAHACVSCHERDGRGRPPAPGGALEELAVKL
ncbi:MAG TPA: di-heme oxidoredictase family protein, partial [Polyangiales bacterium]|nr:di-heme oxidoredictase family protein [Polyangiales bacterium]